MNKTGTLQNGRSGFTLEAISLFLFEVVQSCVKVLNITQNKKS